MNLRILFFLLTLVTLLSCSKEDKEENTLKVEPEQINLVIGQKISLKVISKPKDLQPVLQVADDRIAKLDGVMVEGLKEGETELIARSGALICRVPIKVVAENLYDRKVLAECFTGIGCGACEMVAEPFYERQFSKPMYDSRIVNLSIHYGYKNDDFTLPQFEYYAPFWGKQGQFTPAIMLNRMSYNDPVNKSNVGPMISIGSYASEKRFNDTFWSVLKDLKSVVKLQIKPTQTGGTISVVVTGQFVPSVPVTSQDYFLTVVMTEDGVINPKPITRDKLDHVVRGYFTSAQGDLIKIKDDGSFSFESKSFAPPKDCNLSNVHIVAFVNRYSDTDILGNTVENVEEIAL
ncbi:Omp28-related outer membrane protein [Falsiporphyromonas endometrii]|uniref:Omp28-related outer membrane protein n=1 Tax=Falsiporphyromonas endometrii TaxID=1387297 RepID=A0ABV9K6J4_9PORP